MTPTTEWWAGLKSITLHAEGAQPPLWARSADGDYRAARQTLAAAEIALRDQVEAVAAQRRALPPGPLVPNYQLTEGSLDLTAPGASTRSVTLADLFGERDELIVYHLMFHPDDDAACAACSMFVDGLHGVSHHILRRAALAVVGKAPIDKLRAWGRLRGWQGLRIVSAYGTTFTNDLGTEGPLGGQFPAFSVFARSIDGIRHTYIGSADFPDGSPRGMDLMSPVWNVFDLLPSGRGNKEPESLRPGRQRGALARTDPHAPQSPPSAAVARAKRSAHSRT